jgi:hypothetical protein
MSDEKRAYPLVLIALVLALITKSFWFVWLAGAFVALLIAKPEFLAPIASALEHVGKFIGTWISNLALSVIFVVVIIPYGFLYRSVEKALRNRFFNPDNEATFFTGKKRIYEPKSFEKTW